MVFGYAGYRGLVPFLPRQSAYRRWLHGVPASLRYCATLSTPSRDPYVVPLQSIEKVEEILQHRFRDRSLLAEALTHRSVISSNSSNGIAFYEDSDKELKIISQNNERLELLGDHVFGLLSTHVLYEREDQLSEGEMTKNLQSILSRRTADKFSRSLGIQKLILEADDLKGKAGYRYGDCFEALLAALYLDGGFDTAKNFFHSRVVPNCDIFAGDFTDTNYKRMLQEYLVTQGLPTPALATQVKYHEDDYDSKTGFFRQSMTLFGRKVSVGTGRTRVSAEQEAAKRLLTNLQNAKATCVLIRLARRAGDSKALSKLQTVRAAQVAADSKESGCPR